MNQNPSDDRANLPQSDRAIVAGQATLNENDRNDRFNPILQTALNSLDIKLEDELNRFRSKQADPTAEVAGAPPVEVIWEQQTADFDDADVLTAEIVRSAITYPASDASEKSSANRAVAGSTSGFIVIDGLSTSTTIDRATITTNYDAIVRHREQTDRGNLDLNFSSGGEIAPLHDGYLHDEYLSSSQELLRQIQSGSSHGEPAHNRPRAAQPKSKPDRQISPLKIGSMAAACVLAGGAVYTYLNPSILAPLTATKVVVPTVATTTNSLGQLIQSPNLAANEFTDLSLSTIVTMKPPVTTTAPTATIAAPTGVVTAPTAVPFNSTGAAVVSPTAIITAQPRLADSLVRSLLPPNFYSVADRSNNRTMPTRVRSAR